MRLRAGVSTVGVMRWVRRARGRWQSFPESPRRRRSAQGSSSPAVEQATTRATRWIRSQDNQMATWAGVSCQGACAGLRVLHHSPPAARGAGQSFTNRTASLVKASLSHRMSALTCLLRVKARRVVGVWSEHWRQHTSGSASRDRALPRTTTHPSRGPAFQSTSVRTPWPRPPDVRQSLLEIIQMRQATAARLPARGLAAL